MTHTPNCATVIDATCPGCQAYAFGPDLLAALESIRARANSSRLGTAGVLSDAFHLHEIEGEARAAIAAAKGDA